MKIRIYKYSITCPRSIILGVIVVLSVIALGLGYFSRTTRDRETYPTFFTYNYNDEAFRTLGVPELQHAVPLLEISELDAQIVSIVSELKLSAPVAARLYAYIATGEHEVIMLTKQLGSDAVSVQPVVRKIVCLLLPDACTHIVSSSDAYSQAIADIVMQKISARNAEDRIGIESYHVPQNKYPSYWNTSKKYTDEDVGGWKPWRLTSLEAFQLPPPLPVGSPEAHAQTREVADILATLTPAQRNLALEHASPMGTGTVSADILKQLFEFQREDGIELTRVAQERLTITHAIVDTFIVTYAAKYTYWYPRPEMLDANIKPLIPTPQNPSYPSINAAVEATASKFVEEWYPKHASAARMRRVDAANARVNAGIHFRADVDASIVVADKILDFYLGEADHE